MKTQMRILMLVLVSISITALTNAQVITYGGGRVSDRQIRTLLTRISTESATFRNEVMSTANRTVLNANREDRIDNMIDQFSTAINTLNNQYDGRRDVTVEVRDVLERAANIDRFMQRNNLNYRAENR